MAVRRLRTTVGDLPIMSETVPFVLVSVDNGFTEPLFAQTIEDKLALVSLVDHGDVLLAVWPGQFKSDVFRLDPVAMLAALEAI